MIKINIDNIVSALEVLNKDGYWIHNCKICKCIIYSNNLNCLDCIDKIKNTNFHAAGVLVYTEYNNEKYLLLGEASKHKPFHRRFKNEFFGGVKESNENAIETAIRETKEETSNLIHIDKKNLEFLTIYKTYNHKDYILFSYKIDHAAACKIISKFTPCYEINKLLLIEFKNIYKSNLSKFNHLILGPLEKRPAEKLN